MLIHRWYPIAFLFAVLSAVLASVQRPCGTKGDPDSRGDKRKDQT